MKKKAKTAIKKALSVWRTIVFLLALVVILPLSLKNIQNQTYYYSIFSICLLIILISFIIRLITIKIGKKKINIIHNYVNIILLYSFISLALFFVTYLLATTQFFMITKILVVISSISLSATFSRARLLFTLI